MNRPRRPWTEAEREVLRQGRAQTPPRTWDSLAREIDRDPSCVCAEGSRLRITNAQPRSRAGQDVRPQPARPAPAQRRCLKCRDDFRPQHAANWVCTSCKSTVEWQVLA